MAMKRKVQEMQTVSDQGTGSSSKRIPTDFESLVYKACRNIPKGKVATYGVLAMAISKPNAFRAVGSALRKNPFAPEVPCHRVVAADLSLGGFCGSKDPKGHLLKKKVGMLLDEGVRLSMYNGSSRIRVSSIEDLVSCENIRVDADSVVHDIDFSKK